MPSRPRSASQDAPNKRTKRARASSFETTRLSSPADSGNTPADDAGSDIEEIERPEQSNAEAPGGGQKAKLRFGRKWKTKNRSDEEILSNSYSIYIYL